MTVQHRTNHNNVKLVIQITHAVSLRTRTMSNELVKQFVLTDFLFEHRSSSKESPTQKRFPSRSTSDLFGKLQVGTRGDTRSYS